MAGLELGAEYALDREKSMCKDSEAVLRRKASVKDEGKEVSCGLFTKGFVRLEFQKA